MADSNEETTFFPATDSASCRVETDGGTVYWLSGIQEDGYRWVVREHLESSDTNTMVMHRSAASKESADLGDKFRGKLQADVEVGKPLVLEVVERETSIRSEPVACIEVGNIPQMIFG